MFVGGKHQADVTVRVLASPKVRRDRGECLLRPRRTEDCVLWRLDFDLDVTARMSCFRLKLSLSYGGFRVAVIWRVDGRTLDGDGFAG